MRFCKAVLILPLFAAACSAQNQHFAPVTPAYGQHSGNLHSYATNGTFTIAGPITGTIAGGITVNAKSGCTPTGNLHVFTNSSTVISGPTPTVGQNVTATGTGTCTTSMTATNLTVVKATTPATTIPIPTAQRAVGSTVYSTGTGMFTLNPEPSLGYMHIFTPSTTIFGGLALKTGEYAQVTGTGTNNGFQGVYVSVYATPPPTITVTGTAQAAQPYGFTAYIDATHTAVPILLSGSTIVAGATLATGTTVKVTGAGDTGVSITATQVVVTAPTASPSPNQTPSPTPPPIAQTHLLTADYLGAPYGTTTVAASAAAPYLTWAQTSIANANSTSAAGIKTQYYVDPNRTVAGVGDALYTSDESTFAHDCNNNRVTDTYSGTVTQYVMDPTSPDMQALFASTVANAAAQAHFDAIYEDDDGALSGFSAYTPFSAMPCNYTDAAWLAEELVLNAASSVPVMFNGLSALNNDSVSLAVGLLGPTTLGGNYEHCYSDDATPKMTGWLWQAIENTELTVNAQSKAFECQLRNASTASTATDARTYALASFLLTYNPATNILWEEFGTPSGLHVGPESQLVVENPVVAAPSAITGLQVAGGTYGREYKNCYIAGAFVSSCAVVVNPDSQLSHPFPYPQYNHTLVLTGNGILDGGTMATNGPPPPVNLAPSEAAIVFP